MVSQACPHHRRRTTRTTRSSSRTAIRSSPTGGKAQAEASASASAEAEYKTADMLYGSDKECASTYAYGIQYRNSHSVDYTLCFTRV